jgi:hypothetical protein
MEAWLDHRRAGAAAGAGKPSIVSGVSTFDEEGFFLRQ